MDALKVMQLPVMPVQTFRRKEEIDEFPKLYEFTTDPDETPEKVNNGPIDSVLKKSGLIVPTARKTGTTIVGVMCQDGVVLGCDTRATEGPIVADKNCMKVHFISDNIYCCGAGTAADCDHVTRQMSSEMALHAMELGKSPRVITVVTRLKQKLFQYRGHIGAALIIGGVDETGPHLCSIHPHGSVDFVPYLTMGSGSLAAMATLESRFKFNMTRDEAENLVRAAIRAGILNDLYSGSNCDIAVITADGVDYKRTRDQVAPSGERIGKYSFVPGSTSVLKESTAGVSVEVEAMIVTPIPPQDQD